MSWDNKSCLLNIYYLSIYVVTGFLARFDTSLSRFPVSATNTNLEWSKKLGRVHLHPLLPFLFRLHRHKHPSCHTTASVWKHQEEREYSVFFIVAIHPSSDIFPLPTPPAARPGTSSVTSLIFERVAHRVLTDRGMGPRQTLRMTRDRQYIVLPIRASSSMRGRERSR